MKDSIKLTLAVDKMNRRIADLNIKISKDSSNIELKKELEELLLDRNRIYKGNENDVKEIIKKYGDTSNE